VARYLIELPDGNLNKLSGSKIMNFMREGATMSEISVPETARTIATRKARVLLVDDQVIIADVIGRMLSDQPDIEFHFVDNADMAVRTASELKPTVILQDLGMPGIDGFELVRLFRAAPETMDVPVIMLSAKEEPTFKAEAFNIGANDYVVKLPDRVELIARIRYHSAAYISRLERDEAFRFLRESQQKLADANMELRKLTAVDAELQKLAARDALTGLANRRKFDDVVRTEWPRAQREKYPISLLLCDVDSFKPYNESAGPEAGDACLKKIAAILTKSLRRPADLAARYGDEFALVLPNTDSEGAMIVAEACRAAVEALKIGNQGSKKNVITLSIGVASITPAENAKYEDLFTAAARGLKNAKDQGRNLVRIARHRGAVTAANANPAA
jgi:two-component system chemotaxis family response regulator WspR